MALTPFIDPNLFDVTRQMSRALEPFFQPMGFPSLGRLGGMSQLHPMDIVEHPDHYSIVADAPGFAPEDVTVEMRDNNIVINGEKRIEKETTDEKQGVRIHRNERTFNKFSRSFAVPEGTKAESITAKIENGVLTVDIPKVEQTAAQAEAKRIKVTGGGGTAGRITAGTEGVGAAGAGTGVGATTPPSGAATTGTTNVPAAAFT